MGDGSIIIAVADAGPLIHLSEIGALSLLRIFTAVYVPTAVWQEATMAGRVLPTDLQACSTIRYYDSLPEDVERFVRDNALMHLHTGECESLYVCGQEKVDFLLTDDLAVREAAKLLGLTPVGSLGIIVRAYRLQVIPFSSAERYILDLQDVSSLFVTRAIVELAIESLS